MWQKCPVCDGQGNMVVAPGLSAVTCDICEGRKIIGPDGKPPVIEQSEVQASDECYTPPSPFDELSDDEIQYWSTPHYDELQAKKQMAAEQRKIDDELRRSHG